MQYSRLTTCKPSKTSVIENTSLYISKCYYTQEVKEELYLFLCVLFCRKWKNNRKRIIIIYNVFSVNIHFHFLPGAHVYSVYFYLVNNDFKVNFRVFQ